MTDSKKPRKPASTDKDKIASADKRRNQQPLVSLGIIADELLAPAAVRIYARNHTLVGTLWVSSEGVCWKAAKSKQPVSSATTIPWSSLALLQEIQVAQQLPPR